jgi:hypothetical protein
LTHFTQIGNKFIYKVMLVGEGERQFALLFAWQFAICLLWQFAIVVIVFY